MQCGHVDWVIAFSNVLFLKVICQTQTSVVDIGSDEGINLVLMSHKLDKNTLNLSLKKKVMVVVVVVVVKRCQSSWHKAGRVPCRVRYHGQCC